jgi:hypothetical protein
MAATDTSNTGRTVGNGVLFAVRVEVIYKEG